MLSRYLWCGSFMRAPGGVNHYPAARQNGAQHFPSAD
jgi:hypothetical protein